MNNVEIARGARLRRKSIMNEWCKELQIQSPKGKKMLFKNQIFVQEIIHPKKKTISFKNLLCCDNKKRVASPEELKVLIINNDKQEKWYTKNYSLQRGI